MSEKIPIEKTTETSSGITNVPEANITYTEESPERLAGSPDSVTTTMDKTFIESDQSLREASPSPQYMLEATTGSQQGTTAIEKYQGPRLESEVIASGGGNKTSIEAKSDVNDTPSQRTERAGTNLLAWEQALTEEQNQLEGNNRSGNESPVKEIDPGVQRAIPAETGTQPGNANGEPREATESKQNQKDENGRQQAKGSKSRDLLSSEDIIRERVINNNPNNLSIPEQERRFHPESDYRGRAVIQTQHGPRTVRLNGVIGENDDGKRIFAIAENGGAVAEGDFFAVSEQEEPKQATTKEDRKSRTNEFAGELPAETSDRGEQSNPTSIEDGNTEISPEVGSEANETREISENYKGPAVREINGESVPVDITGHAGELNGERLFYVGDGKTLVPESELTPRLQLEATTDNETQESEEEARRWQFIAKARNRIKNGIRNFSSDAAAEMRTYLDGVKPERKTMQKSAFAVAAGVLAAGAYFGGPEAYDSFREGEEDAAQEADDDNTTSIQLPEMSTSSIPEGTVENMANSAGVPEGTIKGTTDGYEIDVMPGTEAEDVMRSVESAVWDRLGRQPSVSVTDALKNKLNLDTGRIDEETKLNISNEEIDQAAKTAGEYVENTADYFGLS